MREVLLAAYEICSPLVPFLIIGGILLHDRRKKGEGISRGTVLPTLVFALALTGVWTATGSGTLYDLLRFQPPVPRAQINLVPFSRTVDPAGYFLNIVMLVPAGFLIPLLMGERGSFFKTCLSGFLISALAEISQLFNHRSTDVDDLLTNTLGAALGWTLFLLWKKLRGERAEEKFFPGLLIFTAAATFLGRFFLFNEMGAARLLYGF